MSVKDAELEGLREAMNHYSVFSEVMQSNMVKAIKALAQKIVENARGWLKRNGSVVLGTLRQSGSVRPQPDGTIDAGFEEGYAYFVEYGRKAGGFPPLDRIEQWVRDKKKRGSFVDVEDKDIPFVALSIARRITYKGTKAHPFLMPAVAQEKKKCNKFWRTAYQNAVKEFDLKKKK